MHAVAAAQQYRCREHAGEPVGGEEIAEVQQRGVHESKDHEHGVPPEEHAAHAFGCGAGSILAPGQLHQPVAEHHGEYGVGAGVRERQHREVHPPLESERVRREARSAKRHASRIGKRDEQQHRSTREVRRQRPFAACDRTSGLTH